MSTGSISTYRNKKRACCPTLAASSVLYAVFTAKRRGDVDISGILLKRLYGIHQRLTGHLDITLHDCLYGGTSPKQLKNLGRHTPFDGSGCAGMTEIMEPRVPKSHVTPSPKYYSFPTFDTPAISIPLQNFRRLERRKTGKIAPKRYRCRGDSVSRAIADRQAYIVQKANSVVTGSVPPCG